MPCRYGHQLGGIVWQAIVAPDHMQVRPQQQ
jgi:hypothetical protein